MTPNSCAVTSAIRFTAGTGIGSVKALFGLGKILAGCTAGVLAIGVAAYALKERHPNKVIPNGKGPGADINQPTTVTEHRR